MSYALGIILDWYDPFDSIDDLNEFAKIDWGSGWPTIYTAISMDNLFSRVEYIGITANAGQKFKNHHKIDSNKSGKNAEVLDW